MDNYFAELGFKAGDIVICCGTAIGAPKSIIGKAFKLDSSYMFFEPCLHIDGDDCHYYTGDHAKWRAPRVGDGTRSMATLKASFDGEDIHAVETGETLNEYETRLTKK